MTLLDILVRELPKRGGWPDGVRTLEQYGSGFVYDSRTSYTSEFPLEIADFWSTSLVTREQYEEALAASKPVWNGKGLPPVGLNCEVLFKNDTGPEWFSFVATFIGTNHVVALVGLEELSYKKESLLSPDVQFRPIRSQEERKRDEILASLETYLVSAYADDSAKTTEEHLYDAIADGKIPPPKNRIAGVNHELHTRPVEVVDFE